jgi:hypothetical protein
MQFMRNRGDPVPGPIGYLRCKNRGWPARWFFMEYRGKQYTVVQGIGPSSWKWKVQLDGSVKSGEAATRTSVVWAIDRALAPKKVKPIPPTE